MTSRIRPLTVEDDDDDASFEDSPNENREYHKSLFSSIEKDLDYITKTLDDDDVTFDHILEKARNRHTPNIQRTPPTSSLPTFHENLTSSRSQLFPTPKSAPRPVESPAPQWLSYIAATEDPTPEQMHRKNMNSIPSPVPNNKNNDDMKSAIESMRNVVERQEARMRQLEIENQELRDVIRHLRSRERMIPQTEPRRRPPTEYTPPRRRYEDISLNPSRRESSFSPGTRFVAELSKVMDLEVGHHAPLSLILDRELERQHQESYF